MPAEPSWCSGIAWHGMEGQDICARPYPVCLLLGIATAAAHASAHAGWLQALLGMASSPKGTSSMDPEGNSASEEGEEAPQPSVAAQQLGAWEEMPRQAGAGRSFARTIQQLSQGQSVPSEWGASCCALTFPAKLSLIRP